MNNNDLLAANAAFYRAFEKKDIQAMSKVWSSGTGSLCIHPGGKIIQGWNDIHTSWEKIFQATQYLEIETEVTSVEVSGDLGYVVLRENVLQISRGRRLQAQSIATNIFAKMAEKWYMVHHHASPLMR
ncbi:nuclear transport factor 2 family protein [Oscillatoria salina]|uniref:nuclear transport factor 2 family protein n=1 Tax=Oscillatoria salina TaxID=331517 RepID=UPI0013BDD38E|nr:nuclear transport factor 2 family protein [Oscillatoria salina]MBZ8181837.1 nuclear transport factor 2 family protein [Oscillatoria salina IIICB1]NET87057.1 nuclear transport factor 2 family protein [Kamptonema sp. SIO1D9]